MPKGVTLKRYNFEGVEWCPYEAEDGDWIKSEAALARVAELEAEVKELQDSIDEAHHD